MSVLTQGIRIFLTGVGGQGTLTATRLLAQTALDEGLAVTSGEIHGMAQRGGVVESTVLLGGYQSPKICPGEADILLGFERLETLRALPYLKQGGIVLSNNESIAPLGVNLGQESYPELAEVEKAAAALASKTLFIPCQSLAGQAGNPKAANTVLLGALAGLGVLPFGVEALARTLSRELKPALVGANLAALELGARAGAV